MARIYNVRKKMQWELLLTPLFLHSPTESRKQFWMINLQLNINNRSHGLDVLRCLAISLVFMAHYSVLTKQTTLGILGHTRGIGVDLSFILSGYLIGHQIISAFAKDETFSLYNFYNKRMLRTLPAYLFILGIYFLIPSLRERPLVTPLWKFLTFTQNFGLTSGAFSHIWSLCVEEQFYLIFPIIALVLARQKSLKAWWLFIASILLIEIILRMMIWLNFIYQAGNDTVSPYLTYIYYPTYCRLDSIVIGISLALLRNYHTKLWANLTKYGNILLVIGILSSCFMVYLFQKSTDFFPSVFGFSLRAISLSTLILAALSTNSWLYKFRIPGAMTLALYSYPIYLTHKQFIHVTNLLFSSLAIGKSSLAILFMSVLSTLIGAWMLHITLEKPFLKLRNKIKINSSTRSILPNPVMKAQ